MSDVRRGRYYGYQSAPSAVVFFFFNDTATTEIYTLSLHDALPIWQYRKAPSSFPVCCASVLVRLGKTVVTFGLLELNGQTIFIFMQRNVSLSAVESSSSSMIWKW